MTFVVGWSGLSIASNNVTQLGNQSGSMLEPSKKSEHLESASMNMHVKASMDHQAQANHHDLMQNHSANCHDNVSSQTTHHTNSQNPIKSHCESEQTISHCFDCNINTCQTTVSWLDIDVLALDFQVYAKQNQHRYLDYNAQHLSGFWRDILRPPKA